MIPRKGTCSVLLFSVITFLLSAIVYSEPIAVYTSEPSIRVCLAEGVRTLSLRLSGRYSLVYQGVVVSKQADSSIRFYFSRDGMPVAALSNEELKFLSTIRINADSGMTAGLDGVTLGLQTYPGSFEVVPSGDGTYRFINIVPLETYLRGVVPNELINHLTSADLQACMAQAIAARNYAFFRMSNVDSTDRSITRIGFDVYADTRDQVYSGTQRYNSLADSAIEFTSGMIVEYNGEPARCFFHSTCGGYTEDVQHVWQGQPPQPYLEGVSDIDSSTGQPFCVYSPQYYWSVVYTDDDLNFMAKRNMALANPMYADKQILGRVASLTIVDRFKSFRVDTLEITMTNGDKYYVRGDRTRYFFKSSSGQILRSSLFRIAVARDARGSIRRITIKGQGSGHGVGMCQWGALGMSRLGYTYTRILAHYYPGTIVKKVY